MSLDGSKGQCLTTVRGRLSIQAGTAHPGRNIPTAPSCPSRRRVRKEEAGNTTLLYHDYPYTCVAASEHDGARAVFMLPSTPYGDRGAYGVPFTPMYCRFRYVLPRVRSCSRTVLPRQQAALVQSIS